jgi:hypothetical protein
MSEDTKYYKVGRGSGTLMHNRNKLNGYFDTEEEAREDYRLYIAKREELRAEAESMANEKLDAAESALRGTLSEHVCSLSFCMEGDTHGIYKSGLYLSVTVDGFDFGRTVDL